MKNDEDRAVVRAEVTRELRGKATDVDMYRTMADMGADETDMVAIMTEAEETLARVDGDGH